LTVSAFWHDPTTGDWQLFTDWDDGHAMAGPERARWQLWGDDAVKDRGATFLPRLAESNLWVMPEESDAFVAEVGMLLADVDGLFDDLGWGPGSLLPHYLNNFLRAAEYARARVGGVTID